MSFSTSSLVSITNKYTGRVSGPFAVIAVSAKGNKITVARPDFANGQETFTFKPTYDQFSNDYSGSLANAV